MEYVSYGADVSAESCACPIKRSLAHRLHVAFVARRSCCNRPRSCCAPLAFGSLFYYYYYYYYCYN
eukprot:4055414-Heterocapsa_arctica.AAC.1